MNQKHSNHQNRPENTQGDSKKRNPDRNIIYHFLVGLGFLALIGWFYLMREIEFMTWVTALGPETHKGAMNMLAVMIWMLPAFLCWKYYMRYINRKLDIQGIFYEDHYYGKPTPVKDKPESNLSDQDNDPKTDNESAQRTENATTDSKPRPDPE
ncbi:hypothetical protein [Motiliproteus sp. MSK22-1]|uniref:hypothetical protein n=1 Tax=Motiliproteus sp. MSK22-1 TaxID=1897630 RepID=UPI00097679B5|nr:hypothetical protein [Motiliproteus sp. MSK22-1]OMH25263.1 hypothetical protein BGP75_26045 [Motiliproteus sp. MSK22-1]